MNNPVNDEEWRFTDYPNYEVSNMGRVRRKLKESRYNVLRNRHYHYSTGVRSGNGYKAIAFHNSSQRALLHRIIAKAFIPNPDNKPCVDHINGIRDDNRVENLRWVTASENHGNRKNSGCVFEITPGRYQVTVMKRGVNHYLGVYTNREIADEVRKYHHARLHREYSPYWVSHGQAIEIDEEARNL